MDEKVEEMRMQALGEIDTYACIMEGKVIAAVGMFATPSCISLYSDGGKTCTDSTDCEGDCTSREVLDTGIKASGFCQVGYGDPSCYNLINQGITEHAVCSD